MPDLRTVGLADKAEPFNNRDDMVKSVSTFARQRRLPENRRGIQIPGKVFAVRTSG